MGKKSVFSRKKGELINFRLLSASVEDPRWSDKSANQRPLVTLQRYFSPNTINKKGETPDSIIPEEIAKIFAPEDFGLHANLSEADKAKLWSSVYGKEQTEESEAGEEALEELNPEKEDIQHTHNNLDEILEEEEEVFQASSNIGEDDQDYYFPRDGYDYEQHLRVMDESKAIFVRPSNSKTRWLPGNLDMGVTPASFPVDANEEEEVLRSFNDSEHCEQLEDNFVELAGNIEEEGEYFKQLMWGTGVLAELPPQPTEEELEFLRSFEARHLPEGRRSSQLEAELSSSLTKADEDEWEDEDEYEDEDEVCRKVSKSEIEGEENAAKDLLGSFSSALMSSDPCASLRKPGPTRSVRFLENDVKFAGDALTPDDTSKHTGLSRKQRISPEENESLSKESGLIPSAFKLREEADRVILDEDDIKKIRAFAEAQWEAEAGGKDIDEELEEQLKPAKKTLEWDCETILTTLSNVSNHPFKMSLDLIPKKKIIGKIESGTGVALDYLPEYMRRAAQDKDKFSSSVAHTKAEDTERNEQVDLPAISTTRRKDETPEEKRQRKANVKQSKKIVRFVKKENKLLFKEEKALLYARKAISNPNDCREGVRYFRF